MVRNCPNCGHSVADGVLFCQECGTKLPEQEVKIPEQAVQKPVTPPAPPKPVAMKPAKKQKSHRGLLVAVWTSLVVNVLICALLLSWTLGLFGPIAKRSQVDALEERIGELEEAISNAFGPEGTRPQDPTDPTDPEVPTDPEDPVPSDPAPTYPTETVPVRPSYTLKVWTAMEDQIEDINWLGRMEEAFQTAHPEYELVFENALVAEGDAANVVSSDPQAAADVYMFASDQLQCLIEAGALTKLGGSFREQVLRDNSALAVNTATYTDGGIYGFPVTNTTWFMYYDKDVYTQEDVRSLDTMLAKGKVDLPLSVAWYAGTFFLGTGGTVFGESGNDVSAGIQFGGDRGYMAAEKMIQVAQHPNCITSWSDIGKLIDGEAAAVFSGSWDAAQLREAMGDRLGVAPLPNFNIGATTYSMKALSGTKCVGVNPYSNAETGKHKVAMQFAAFLASPEAQLDRYEMRGVIPAAQSLRYHEMIMMDPVAVAEMDTMTYSSVAQPGLREMSNYWSPMDNFGCGVINGDITMDNYKDMVDLLMEMLNDDPL